MNLLAVIEAVATLLWCHAGVTLASWIARVAGLDRSQRVAAVTGFAGHLVPAMILLVLTVLIGSVAGLPSVVVLVALLFPAGLAYGAHMALNETEPRPTPVQTLSRALAALALAALIVYVRQLR